MTTERTELAELCFVRDFDIPMLPFPPSLQFVPSAIQHYSTPLTMLSIELASLDPDYCYFREQAEAERESRASERERKKERGVNFKGCFCRNSLYASTNARCHQSSSKSRRWRVANHRPLIHQQELEPLPPLPSRD